MYAHRINLPETSYASCTTRSQERMKKHAAAPNVRLIRSNPSYHSQNCINRNYASLSDTPHQIARLYDEWASLQTSLRAERGRHNSLSGRLRAASPLKSTSTGDVVDETREALLAEAKELKAKIVAVEAREAELEAEMQELALQLPTSPTRTYPLATSQRCSSTELSLLDFSDASTVSGWGWYYFLNEAVLLEQALINYALSLALSRGWKLPRDQHGEQQIYTLQQSASHQGKKPEHALAGTAEIPLAGMYANTTFTEDELPVKLVGVSRCYRAEAGARGVHEFTKVEMFAWTMPDANPPIPPNPHAETATPHPTTPTPTPSPSTPPQSSKIFSEMLTFQKDLLRSLHLPSRIILMPSTDLGASASQKIDIETYMPSRYNTANGPWGEVSSLSNCLDYQARRLNARVKLSGGPQGGKRTDFPYTLNGTAVAVPRVMLALMENGWDEEMQGIVVPEVLRKWMGGVEVIRKKH
ncbi:hypothetical protein BDZ91DRAFT_775715 [Kalaharituber pfeilii]|nr:hypothetical protein BDZ91DRAFT_775715 [Kalaharituber pfeilii]